MNEHGVVSITDYLPRPRIDKGPSGSSSATKPLLPWLVRRVDCIRGSLPMQMQCAPAFNYGLSAHATSIVDDDTIPAFRTGGNASQKKALFQSDSLALDLRYVSEVNEASTECDHITAPEITLEILDLSKKGHKGFAAQSNFTLREGQCVTFVLRTPPTKVKADEASSGESQLLNPDSNGGKTEAAVLKGLVGSMTLGENRAIDDPFLTKELLSSLLQVRSSERLL